MFNAFRAWFANIGKLPAAMMSELQNEGLILMDEKLRGTITYRNFRAPGKRFGYKTVWFRSCIVVTKMRIFATAYTNLAIDVAFTDERIRAMQFSVEEGPRLLIAFDASLFHPEWSGALEYRFTTPNAQKAVDSIQQEVAANG